MSLKTLISSLIESVFTSKKSFISNQSMPSSTVTDYEYTTPTDQHFTAPNDGYLTIGASVGEGNWSRCVMWGGIEAVSAAEEPTAAYVPVLKGQTVYFSVSVIRFVKFVSTIGGGGLTRLFKAEVHYAFA